MTTDVINGVPRDWLKQLHRDLDACQKLIWANLRGCDPAYCADAQARLAEIETMLATAQPAADGERELIREVFLRNGFSIKDGHDDLKPYVYAAGFDLLEKARATQPQQAVAVTDAMVLAARGVCVSFRGHYGEHNDYLDDCTARQIIEAALSAHKTGEEE